MMRLFSSSKRSARDMPDEDGLCWLCDMFGVPKRDCEFKALLELDMFKAGLEPLLLMLR